jgi:hypothetical protein
MELLTVIGTLAVVIVGLLVMTRLVELEALGNGIVRICLVLILLVIAFWALKVIVLPILVFALVWLKQAMLVVAIVVSGVLGIAVILRIAFMKFTKQASDRTGHKEKQL